MKYLFYPIHFVVGGLIRLIDLLTSPKPMQRSRENQAKIDESCKNLTLYHYPACPFCVRVRRNMKRLNLPIRQIDPRKDTQALDLLQNKGGKVQVPCLQIVDPGGNSQWMYESADINAYLEEKFPADSAQA